MTRLFALFLALLAVPAGAQISLDELKTGVAERTGELAEFERILTSDDPATVIAAMQLMIEKGDADQRRMAVRQGLFSADSAVRQTVLRAIFNSKPSLVINMVPTADKPTNGYFNTIRSWQGSRQDDNSGSIVMRLTHFDAEQGCWFFEWGGRPYGCGAKMSGDVVSILFGSSWSQYTLNAEGQLTGNHTVEGNIVAATISLVE